MSKRGLHAKRGLAKFYKRASIFNKAKKGIVKTGKTVGKVGGKVVKSKEFKIVSQVGLAAGKMVPVLGTGLTAVEMGVNVGTQTAQIVKDSKKKNAPAAAPVADQSGPEPVQQFAAPIQRGNSFMANSRQGGMQNNFGGGGNNYNQQGNMQGYGQGGYMNQRGNMNQGSGQRGGNSFNQNQGQSDENQEPQQQDDGGQN